MQQRVGRRGRKASSASTDRPLGVQSLARALSILQALSESHEGLTLTGLSDIVKLPPSTAHRLLTTLQQQRFVRFEPTSMLWQIGVQAFVVGNAFTRTRDVVTIARPYMRRLMEDSGETVNLYVLSEDEAICMAQVESRQMMRAISRPGGRVSLHMSGAGKALLACLPEHEVERIVKRKGLQRSTDRTLTTLRALKADLRNIRTRGFAIDDEEFAVGLRCVAASILDERGSPLIALSLSGPTVRVSDERLSALGAQVIEATRATAVDLGVRGPLA